MIVIIEHRSKEVDHLLFNTGLIELILEYRKDLLIVCDKIYKNNINEELNCNDNVKYRYIKTMKSKYNIINNIIVYLQIKFILKQYKFEKIVFANVTFEDILYMALVCIKNKEKNILLFHGDLEKVIKYKNAIFRKVFSCLINTALSFSRYCVVFGESIKLNLFKYLKINQSNLISMHLTYRFKNTEIKKINMSKINIATIGVASKRKGLLLYDNIVDEIKNKYKFNVEFYHLGKVRKDKHIYLSKNIDWGKNGISNNEMKSKIQNIDYILLPYLENTYKLTASGCLFDALNYNKPIIAIKNDYMNYYFKKYSEIGYLVTKEDVIEVIENIIKVKDINEYTIKIKNIIKAKKNIESEQKRIIKYIFDN